MPQKSQNVNFEREIKVENKLKIRSNRFLLISLLEAFHGSLRLIKCDKRIPWEKLK